MSSAWMCNWWCQPVITCIKRCQVAWQEEQMVRGFFLALADLKELALSRAALCLLRWSLGRSDWVQEAVSLWSCAVWVYCFWTGPRKRRMTPSVYFINQLCNICLYYAVWHSVISSTIHKMGDLGWVSSSLNIGFKKNVQHVAKVWTLPVYCSRREVRVC